MASIQKRPDGQWRARYRDETGREHARHFARKIDAQRWVDGVTASVVRGDYVDPRAGAVTLAEYAGRWQASHVSRDNTARIADNALRVHVLPVLGDRSLSTLRRSDVQGLMRALSDHLAPRTLRNVHDTLKRVLATAVDDRIIAHSPCTRIVLPSVPDLEVEAPTAEQVHALVAAIDPRFRGLVVLLAGSGLRIGEALGLQVADVDFLRRTVRVERQRLQDKTIGPTKTGKSTRTVPLGTVVVDELAAHLANYRAGEWLFTTELGQPLNYRHWRIEWARAQKTAGLVVKTHSLRHFTASALIAGGASVKSVQTVLGHSSAAITLRVYSHLWPGDEDRTRSVMDAALTAPADQVRTETGSQQ